MAKSFENEHPIKAFGWATRDTSGVLSPFNFSRRVTGEKDVQFKVMYCGICHSDLHQLKNEWGNSKYPMVPGHEVVGVVIEVGSKVEKFKVGDKVGVGCMVGSCRKCENCSVDLENYCPRQIPTYNGYSLDGTFTFGGYSDMMSFEYFGLDKPGMHIGVVGLGGLGHMAVKFAKAFGTKVTVISTSANKKQEAIERLGADSFLISRDPEQMKAAMNTLDGIIDTVSAVHPILPLLMLMKSHGRKLVAGSCIGGMKETQEMLDFAAKHNITPDIEVVPMDYVNTALERLLKSDVKYRFVLDIGNTLNKK
uniref:10-hydroxygeraniol oxidoreductase n=1 Tax=Solanum tuberosum TaxID=4113 RepID=M1BA03_SOLTU